MNYVLRIQNLKYEAIINDLNIELKSNTFNILLGKNSSGKTTLVNCISNIYKYSGNIYKSISDKEIGIVTEKNKLLSGTVLYNLKYPLINLGKKRGIDEIVNSFSKKYGINHLLYKDINELSKSEYKLIQILVSLIHDPKLFIIDDTLEDLDSLIRLKIINNLKDLSKDICVFWLTSNSDYLEYADNIILYDSGVIKEIITYKQVYSKEKLFNSLGFKLPFNVEFSNKLKFYNLISDDFKNIDEVVNEIW